jgi:hypothetical protein
MPVDEHGDRVKGSFNASVKFNMETGEYVPFPLASDHVAMHGS